MSISEKDVEKVAELARLALDKQELSLYTTQLQRILGYVEKLSEVSTKGVEPTTHTALETSPMRPDKVSGLYGNDRMSREEALANAPASEKGCFKVPQVIE